MSDDDSEIEMTRPNLSIKEAAKAIDRSEKTVRRKTTDGTTFPNAHRNERGAWVIPVSDLIAAGYKLNAPATTYDDSETTQASRHTEAAEAIEDGHQDDDLVTKIEALETEAAEYRRRAEVAEAVADERGKALDDLRTALRMAQHQLTTGDDDQGETTGSTRPVRKGWSRFRRR